MKINGNFLLESYSIDEVWISSNKITVRYLKLIRPAK